jgi:hypothetical protein
MVKACNHGNFETFQNSSKGHPMKNQNHLGVGLGFQMSCKVEIDFVEVP